MIRRLVIALAAAVAIAGTIALGFWQWGRGEQKTALHDEIEARATAAPVDARMLLAPQADLAALVHRPVVLRGEWIPQRTVYLDNRQMNAVPGFYVVTPLRIAGSQAVMLVQRGWVQRNFERRTDLPPVQTSYTLLSDIQIAAIKERLRMSEAQAKYWPPVEAALRDLAKRKHAVRLAGSDKSAVSLSSAEAQDLQAAAAPLLRQLREDQKREVRALARIIGLEAVASRI